MSHKCIFRRHSPPNLYQISVPSDHIWGPRPYHAPRRCLFAQGFCLKEAILTRKWTIRLPKESVLYHSEVAMKVLLLSLVSLSHLWVLSIFNPFSNGGLNSIVKPVNTVTENPVTLVPFGSDLVPRYMIYT